VKSNPDCPQCRARDEEAVRAEAEYDARFEAVLGPRAGYVDDEPLDGPPLEWTPELFHAIGCDDDGCARCHPPRPPPEPKEPTRVLLERVYGRWTLRLEWRRADPWIGASWRRDPRAGSSDAPRRDTHVWIGLLPCLPVRIIRRGPG